MQERVYMSSKIPYYMAYPEFFMYGTERTERMDYDYMKSMYPDAARRILPFVEEECDRLEYETSMIYDEYPDRLQLRLMTRRIYDRAKDGEEKPGTWLMDLIQVMVCQELLLRRSERRGRRKFY